MIPTTSHGSPSYYGCTPGTGSTGSTLLLPNPSPHHGELLPSFSHGKRGEASFCQLHPKEAVPEGLDRGGDPPEEV